MKRIPLIKLLHLLEQEMQRLGYTRGSFQFYRRRWKMLLQFAKARNETYYSEQLGIDFLEKHFHILEKNFDRTLPQADAQELRVVRTIGDFQLHRTILRRYYKQRPLLADKYFISISKRFKLHCDNKGYSAVTVDHYVKQSERFMDYIISQKIKNCGKITISHIHSYISTLTGYTYKTIEQNICSMRAFFRFLLEIKKVKVDFAAKIPMIQARKRTRIPSVWTEDELKKLLAAIDRGGPKGKRDYAIILLACHLGLRSKDIKDLKITDFDWEKNNLVFTQSKTRTTTVLPITREVGWAVIDYLKYGRPKVDSPNLFVRHMAPFLPFAEGDHLNQLIKTYMQLAHIKISKQQRGMHSLRHTLASMLLEKDTPLTIISDILGHTDVDSTAVYLKVGIKKLKQCALDFDEEVSYE